MSADVLPFDRRYERLYRRALEGELNRWGKWMETRLDYEGYPGINILVAFTMGSGGGTPGHRILCLEMPTDVYSIHQRMILVLDESMREACWVYYVVRMKPDGTLWSLGERCRRLGITEDALRMRVSRARTKLLGIPDQPSCAPVSCQVDSVAS